MYVQHFLPCSGLVKLLLSSAPPPLFFDGKVPFINTERWREDDCFQGIMLSVQNFPFTDQTEHFSFYLLINSPGVLEALSNELTSLSLVKCILLPPPPHPPFAPASCMQWHLNKPPPFTQLLEISFKGSVLAAERASAWRAGSVSAVFLWRCSRDAWL